VKDLSQQNTPEMGIVRKVKRSLGVFPRTYSRVVLTGIVKQDCFCFEEQCESLTIF